VYKPFRWLHLSDLHIGHSENSDNVHELFFKDVRNRVEVIGVPDVVVLSGDLTNIGSEKEFEQLDVFLGQLYGNLRVPGNSTKPILIAVPGNHDMQRPSGAELRSFAWVRDVVDDLGKYTDYAGSGPPAEILKSFGSFANWFSRSVRPRLEQLGAVFSPFPGDYSVDVRLEGRPAVRFVCVNSAWSHYKDVAAGQIVLHPSQVASASTSRGSPYVKGAEEEGGASVMVMHHPVSWLTDACRAGFDEIVYPPGRFDVCLYGHMHQAQSEVPALNAGDARIFFQSPALFASSHYGGGHIRPASGYTFGEMFGNGQLRVWPFRLLKQGGGLSYDYDQSFKPTDCRSGSYALLRASRPGPKPARRPGRRKSADPSGGGASLDDAALFSVPSADDIRGPAFWGRLTTFQCYDMMRSRLREFPKAHLAEFNQIAMDLDQAAHFLKFFFDDFPGIRDYRNNLLAIDDHRVMQAARLPHIVSKWSKQVAANIDLISRHLDGMGPELVRANRSFSLNINKYREVPFVHGWEIVKPFREAYVSIVRYGELEDWGQRSFTVISDGADAPILQLLLGAFRSTFLRLSQGAVPALRKTVGVQPLARESEDSA
jgi:predicted phosphodiesterase